MRKKSLMKTKTTQKIKVIIIIVRIVVIGRIIIIIKKKRYPLTAHCAQHRRQAPAHAAAEASGRPTTMADAC